MKQEQIEELRQAASQFIISNMVARGLRTGGNICFGMMLALIIVWFEYRPDLAVMIITALFLSTIGVMGHILGWFTGTGNRIVAAAKLTVIEQAHEITGLRDEIDLLRHEQLASSEMRAKEAQALLNLVENLRDELTTALDQPATAEIRGYLRAKLEQDGDRPGTG